MQQWRILKFWKAGRYGRQCPSHVVIYRKCTQRTICLLCGKRRLIEKKTFWTNRGSGRPHCPLWIRHCYAVRSAPFLMYDYETGVQRGVQSLSLSSLRGIIVIQVGWEIEFICVATRSLAGYNRRSLNSIDGQKASWSLIKKLVKRTTSACRLPRRRLIQYCVQRQWLNLTRPGHWV